MNKFLMVASSCTENVGESQNFTYGFLYSYIGRHSAVLSTKTGKLTSPTRSSKAMLEKTHEFISSLDRLMALKIINKNNLFVFDETIVGDCVSPPKFVGERRNSGGGNLNVIQTRAPALGSYIPFSMADGSTPFRVFILRTGKKKRKGAAVTTLLPAKERLLRSQPHRLFLSSETGYISSAHFKYIMDEFAKWWTTTRPGLHCFLLCDNVPVHRNKDVVATAKSRGIHLINIMAGSSYWFQVHDQYPFGTLKKMMTIKKFEFLNCFSADPEVRRDQLMCIFYQAESIAFASHVLIKSFEYVGLSPWNPSRILECAEQHSPPGSQHPDEELVNELMVRCVRYQDEKRADLDRLLSTMVRVETKTVTSVEKEKFQDEDDAQNSVEEDEESESSGISEDLHIPTEPPRKRPRKTSC